MPRKTIILVAVSVVVGVLIWLQRTWGTIAKPPTGVEVARRQSASTSALVGGWTVLESVTSGDCGEMVKDLSAGSAYEISEDSEGIVLGKVEDRCPVHWSMTGNTLVQVPNVTSCAIPVGGEGLELRVTRENAKCTLVTAQRLECAYDLGATVSVNGTEAKRCRVRQRIVVVRQPLAKR